MYKQLHKRGVIKKAVMKKGVDAFIHMFELIVCLSIVSVSIVCAIICQLAISDNVKAEVTCHLILLMCMGELHWVIL